MGEQGPIGPTGPSCISENCNELYLTDNTVIIPVQENPISYYTLNLKNNDKILYLNCNLKYNQQSIILIKLDFIEDTCSALISPINGINNNYTETIDLNFDIQYAIMTVTKIGNETFCGCIPYYKNLLNIKI